MLEVKGLYAGYGRVPVLRNIDLAARSGELLLVLGRNGAGKSTLMRAIAGFVKPSQGTVRFDGRELQGLAPETIARRGVRLVLDGHRIFPLLTVADNLKLGAVINPDRSRARILTENVLDLFAILRQKYQSPARDLSGGQQQMLALAQAFIGEPKVLLCDEPSLGLAQALLPPIMSFLKRWAAQGAAIVMVEQQIDVALSIADRVIVLDRGEIVLAGTASEVRDDPQLKQIYLGAVGG
jgi:branched-chain amino acid transport system ATP-binding protein